MRGLPRPAVIRIRFRDFDQGFFLRPIEIRRAPAPQPPVICYKNKVLYSLHQDPRSPPIYAEADVSEHPYRDAHRLFHAAGFLGLPEVPMVYRRLDAEERRFVRSGSVFVWEERSTSSEAAGLGIERWTDGLRWGPSRVRDFLFYQEKFTKAEGNNILTKQTYSAWVDLPNGPKKWHLTAYFTPGSINDLGSIDDIPCMRGLTVPDGMYRRSRTGKRKADTRKINSVDDHYYSPPSPICEPHSPSHGSFPLYLPFDSQMPPSPTSQSISSSSEPTDPHEDGFYAWKRPRMRLANGFSANKQRTPASAGLAPLAYLQSLQHPKRNPADEVVLRAFASYN